MAPRLPSGAALQEAAARARRREAEEQKRRDVVKARIRWVGLVFAAGLLVALMADLRRLAGRGGLRAAPESARLRGDGLDIAAGLDDPRYVDPAGRFSLVPPRHWVRVDRPDSGEFYNVVFRGPREMDLCIQVIATNGLTFDKLVDQLRRVERSLSADTHMDIAYVGPYRAVKRSVQLFRNRVLLLDFVTGDLAHHVQFSAPPDLYDAYEPVFLRLMQTYEPGQILPAPAPPAAD